MQRYISVRALSMLGLLAFSLVYKVFVFVRFLFYFDVCSVCARMYVIVQFHFLPAVLTCVVIRAVSFPNA